jgi:hypothetical protein
MQHPSFCKPAQVDPSTLGQNLFLIIGGLLLVIAAGLLVLIAWIAIKYWLWHARQAKAQRDRHARKFDAGGRRLPPSGRGLCHRCEAVHESVYCLPTGRRLCPTCYQVEIGEEAHRQRYPAQPMS